MIMRKALWQQPAPVPVQKEGEAQPAEVVAGRSRDLLHSQGWCLWRCSALGGEVIAIVSEENVKGVPEGYPVYTEVELEELCREDVSEGTIRLVHEAKKLAGAVVLSVKDARK